MDNDKPFHLQRGINVIPPITGEKPSLRLHVSFSEKACSDLKSSFSYLHRHQGKSSDHHNKQSLKQFNKLSIHTCTLVRNFQIKDLNNYMHISIIIVSAKMYRTLLIISF